MFKTSLLNHRHSFLVKKLPKFIGSVFSQETNGEETCFLKNLAVPDHLNADSSCFITALP